MLRIKDDKLTLTVPGQPTYRCKMLAAVVTSSLTPLQPVFIARSVRSKINHPKQNCFLNSRRAIWFLQRSSRVLTVDNHGGARQSSDVSRCPHRESNRGVRW